MGEKTENNKKGTVKRMRILCIGDSNTWGYNPENGLRIEGRWTRILEETMPEAEIIEEGLTLEEVLSLAPPPFPVIRNGVLLANHKEHHSLPTPQSSSPPPRSGSNHSLGFQVLGTH